MKFIFSIFILIIPFGLAAQRAPVPTAIINPGLTSPEVASLGKFGNIPVSYSTGVPNVTIPIFDIKSGDIDLPISLDYHAGGIRVDEISSCVGIGWALNAGGSVSRALSGYPDEDSGAGYLDSPPFSQVNSNPASNYQYLYNVMLGLAECTPDVFSYSIAGQSGRFIIKKSDRSFIQFPLSGNRIENYNATNYKITATDGIGYIYEQKESTRFGDVNQVNLIPSYTSAWRLTKIVSSNKRDTVYLNYEYSTTTLIQHSKSYSHTLGTDPGGGDIDDDTYINQAVYNGETYIKEIIWRGGKITFNNISDRRDYEGARRVAEVDIYSNLGGGYNILKKVKLNQSYFYFKPNNYDDPTDLDGVNSYRLRLDKVTFSDFNDASPQVYSMTYDNTPMAPRESSGQDVWGFNNGHFENKTLMPLQSVLFSRYQTGNAYYTFGNANREAKSDYIKACSIQSMIYPTGGKTIYELEPHQYTTDANKIVTHSVQTDADGSFRSTSSTSFTLTATMSNLRYSGYISAYNYSNVYDRPRSTLVDQTTGESIITISNMNAASSYSTGVLPVSNVSGPFLHVGHTYVLTTNIYTSNPNVKANLTVYWDEQTNVQEILQGGGLRVKSITNYDANGTQINQKSYSYGTDGSGTLLTPQQYLAITSENTIFRKGDSESVQGSPSPNCKYTQGHPSIIYHANSVVPISQFTGSPVLYSQVTEFDNSSTDASTNGKKIFGYPIFQDQEVLANNSNVFGVQMVSNVWRNGYLSREDTYKSSSSSGYKLLESKQYNYFQLQQNTSFGIRSNTEQMIRVQPRYSYTIDGAHCTTFTSNSVGDDIILDSYDLPTNAIVLRSDTVDTYNDQGVRNRVTHDYYYDDPTHLLFTSKESLNSKSEMIKEIFQYPHDLANNGNVYQKMLSQNIISPVVGYKQQKNGNFLKSTSINYYDWFSNSTLMLPMNIEEQKSEYPLESKVQFNRYDQYGNILEQQKVNGPLQCYLWGYNSQYPIAKIENASYQDVTNVLGQSTIDQLAASTSAYDGQVRSVLNILRTDSRLKNALVTTYTYNPLVGMTSMTDSKGETTTYEYDSFQRLMNVKDRDGNIIKRNDYHYQNQ